MEEKKKNVKNPNYQQSYLFMESFALLRLTIGRLNGDGGVVRSSVGSQRVQLEFTEQYSEISRTKNSPHPSHHLFRNFMSFKYQVWSCIDRYFIFNKVEVASRRKKVNS